MPRGKRKVPIVSAVPDIESKLVSTLVSNSMEINETVNIQTKEQVDRKSDPVIEKSRGTEKDAAPIVLISWTDTSGKRHTRTYTCAEIRIHEDKSETLQRSGRKTTLGMSLEAQVLEVDNR